MIEQLDWNAFNESGDLQAAVERYRERHGCYPERILADKICRNRKNHQYCAGLGIRMNGPNLGRRPKTRSCTMNRSGRSDQKQVNGTQLKVNSVKPSGATRSVG